MNKLFAIALLFLPLSLSAVTSRAWTEVGCAITDTNWSTAASWKQTSGTTSGTLNACGLGGDGVHAYPYQNGDVTTLGAWKTTVDITVDAGDSTRPTVSAITMPNGATLWASGGVTLTVHGKGLYNTTHNLKVHFDNGATLACTSDGSHLTYCIHKAQDSTGTTNNIFEFCGNYTGGACVGPTADSQGYITTPCSTYTHIIGDSTAFTGFDATNISSGSNMTDTEKCVDIENMGHVPSSSSYYFTTIDGDGIHWFNNLIAFNVSDLNCQDKIRKVWHLDIRNPINAIGNSWSRAYFMVNISGCNTVTTPTQPHEIKFVTTDTPQYQGQFYISTKMSWLVDHVVAIAQTSTVNGTNGSTWKNYVYLPYNSGSSTPYGGWSWAGPVNGYSSNTYDTIIIAPYSVAAFSSTKWAGPVQLGEDSTAPSTGTGANVYKNMYQDGWGSYYISVVGNNSICGAQYLHNIAVNGAGRLVSGLRSLNNSASHCHYRGDSSGSSDSTKAALVLFNTCDQATTSSVATSMGQPGCIALINPKGYQSTTTPLTNDRFADISGNIFTRDLVGISQIGAGTGRTAGYSYSPYIRQAFLGYDYNVYSGMTQTGNYKTSAGGNTYLMGPFSCQSSYNSYCTSWGITLTSSVSSNGGDAIHGPFTLGTTPSNAQVGDVLCKSLWTSGTPPSCGVISAISGSQVTVNGPSLYLTDGSTGVSAGVTTSDTIAIYPKYIADTTYDYGTSGRGGNDIPTDPKYIDNTCSLANYDTLQGGPGSYANNALSLFSNMAAMNGTDQSGNSTTFNKAYEIEALVAYIHRCWTPTNLQLKNAVVDSPSCTGTACRCSTAGIGDGTFRCDPGAVPVSIGAILQMVQ